MYMGLSRWLSGKEPTCHARDVKDTGLIPGSGRSLEKGMAAHSSILAWRIPWLVKAYFFSAFLVA